ncbi:hypothetical protein DFH09DRAFT_1311864 [Mycena vulgaris]|nr:hypothetical protein DFH09DRAFT_1311864 [Mycena vulgaris]
MSNWNWRVPGVQVRTPATRIPISTTPASWSSLTFDPLSVFDLRRHLGARMDEVGRYMTSRSKFDTSNIAFLAAGASDDNQHNVDPSQFFPEFDDLRNVTPMGPAGNVERKLFTELARKTMWDLATKGDRATGSTTLILHAHVYLPPSFVKENPGSHAAIATIAQLFIENIGVPTAAAWTRRAYARSWPLSQGNGMVPAAPSTAHLPLIPSPIPRSSHYLFRGRPIGFTPALTPATSAPPPPPVYDIDEINQITVLEGEVSCLKMDLCSAERQVEILHGVVSDYELREERSKAQVLRMEEEISQLQSDLRATRSVVDTSSGTRYTSSPARPRLPATPTRPPPYLASPSRYPPTPRGPQAPAVALGTTTHQFLMNEGLELHCDAVRLICRIFSPLRWSEEIAALSGFPAESRAGLLEALEADGA